MTVPLGEFSFERVVEAAARAKRRLARAVSALDGAGVAHAVAGGHAVAAWVARVDEGGVRNTPDVDLLIRRADFEAASAALASAGFIRAEVGQMTNFRDGPEASRRGVVHLIVAGERVRPEHARPAPDVEESEVDGPFRILTLPALIRMKLTSYRLKDQVHLLDLIDIGLIDQSTVATVPPELAPRLQELIDNPES